MHFHWDQNTLVLLGVGAQLLGSFAKHMWRRPAQQAQIDRIETKVSDALAQIAPVLTALQTTNTQNSQNELAGKDGSQ